MTTEEAYIQILEKMVIDHERALQMALQTPKWPRHAVPVRPGLCFTMKKYLMSDKYSVQDAMVIDDMLKQRLDEDFPEERAYKWSPTCYGVAFEEDITHDTLHLHVEGIRPRLEWLQKEVRNYYTAMNVQV